jgi:hypothetical protein
MERAFKKMIKNYLPNIQVIVPSYKNLIQSQLDHLLTLINLQYLSRLLTTHNLDNPKKQAQGMLSSLPKTLIYIAMLAINSHNL